MQRFVRPEPIDGSTRVQRVFDTQHVAHRACRTVSPGEGSFDEIRDRLRRMARVAHPHLARIVAVGEEDGALKVVSEWLPGGALAGHADPGRLLVGIADALYALHREGLAHGHVHPRSLVFDGEGQLKLVDGGICDGSVLEDIESLGSVLRGLYAGRPMPAALATVASRAVEGGFGDARQLEVALREAIAQVPAERPTVEPDVHLVDTAPPVRERVAGPADDDEPESRWLLLLLLVGVLAVMSVLVAAVVGWWAGLNDAAPPAIVPTPVPVVAPAPVPVEEAPVPVPIPDPAVPRPVAAGGEVPPPAPPVEVVVEPPGPTAAEVHVDPPGAAVVSVERVPTEAVIRVPPPPPPAPAPAPAPVPPPAPTTGWRVVTGPGKAHPTTTLVLDAQGMVQDRVGRQGRPRLEIRCQEHRLTVDLDPGVRAVEVIPNEVGMYPMTALVETVRGQGPPTDLKLRMVDGDNRLYFPTPDRWVGTLGSGGEWSMSYTPFASPGVRAVFDTAGLDAVLPRISGLCRL